MIKKKIENETKEEKFIRIAENRTQRILDNLRLLKNCSNPSSYSYSSTQIGKIFSTIEDELRIVKRSFTHQQKKRFKL